MNTKSKKAGLLPLRLMIVLCLSVMLLSVPFTFAAADNQLAAPAGLRAATVTTSSIKMFWNTVSGASYYRFYLNGSYVGKTNNAYYTCTGLSENTKYGFKVCAVDSSDNLGAYSSNVYVKTKEQEKTVLAAPAGLRSATVANNSIKMFWNAVPGASYYRFYVNGVYVGTKTTNCYYTATGLSENTKYGFKVCAVDSSDVLGLYSGNVYVTTTATLTAPLNLKAASIAAKTVDLTWDAVAGASYYKVYQNGVYKSMVKSAACTVSGLTADTSYAFYVVPFDIKNTQGPSSATLTVKTLLNATDVLWAYAKANDAIIMKWNRITGVTYYRFYMNGVVLAIVNTNTYYATGLTANTKYIFKVAACDSSGKVIGAYSSNVAVRTTLTAPQNLHATQTTSNLVSLQWDALAGASYYMLYNNDTYIARVTGVTYTVTGLAADTVYNFKVYGAQSDGTMGTASTPLSVRTYLPAPGNLKKTAGTTTSLTMAWDSVPGATQYRFYLNGACVATTANTFYINYALTPNTRYCFKVAAVGSAGKVGLYSSNVYVNTNDLLAKPGYLHASSVSATSITMTWNAVTNASYYRFYLNGSFLGLTTDTSYTVNSLTNNTTYGFKVAAVGSDSALGYYTDTVYVKTTEDQLTAPQNLRVTDVTSSTITMAWDNVTNASYYRFYLNGTFIAKVYATSYTSYNLAANTVYSFMVTAVSATGLEGAVSATVNIKTQQAGLAAPGDLAPDLSALTSTSIKMTWDTVYGASYYRLYKNDVLVGTTAQTNYTCNGLTANTQYSFRVSAVDSNNYEGTLSGYSYVRTNP